MAQTVNTCLAKKYSAPVFTVQSFIGRGDDLIRGKSYYNVEVEAVLARVEASERGVPHLFLFDELFRGTNAVERIAAGEAVLRELVGNVRGSKPHVVLAATHDAELVDLLSDAYDSYHFADAVGPEGLAFEYRLEPGPATTRNAIALLELLGAPPSLVEGALNRAAELDRLRAGASDRRR
jgi:DNA mismatch repair ATPase MutS